MGKIMLLDLSFVTVYLPIIEQYNPATMTMELLSCVLPIHSQLFQNIRSSLSVTITILQIKLFNSINLCPATGHLHFMHLNFPLFAGLEARPLSKSLRG